MSAMEVNKFVAAVLVAGLVFMAINVIVDETLHEPPLPRTVYPVPGAEEAPAATAEEAPAEEAAPTLAAMLAAADAEAGAKVFKKCAACHDATKGGPNKVGPNLWDIVGRPVASHPGYKYSDALKSLGGEWDYERLSAFIESPKSFAPGTKMGFAGVKAPEKRADLIAYLRGLSDQPPPLPAP